MTADGQRHHHRGPRGRNGAVVMVCGAMVLAMAGLSYAAVPLYRLFCQVTGYAGTTQRAEKASDTVLDRVVKVHFDANVSKDLPWQFEPMQSSMEVKVGENSLAFYKATNVSDRPTTGTSVFNVAPDAVGSHFNKVQCFCFVEQTLEPGQSIEMAVSFYVDTEFVNDEETKNLPELTLSYSFYRVENPQKTQDQAAVRSDGKGG
jgi:cytochrome c oxidase assembly protein subunit 11